MLLTGEDWRAHSIIARYSNVDTINMFLDRNITDLMLSMKNAEPAFPDILWPAWQFQLLVFLYTIFLVPTDDKNLRPTNFINWDTRQPTL